MFLPVQFVADWTRIRVNKQKSINKSNERENSKRIPHEYEAGDRVLLTTPGCTTLNVDESDCCEIIVRLLIRATNKQTDL